MRKTLLILWLGLLAPVLRAATLTEGFEEAVVVDEAGTPVAGNYTAGAGLSNGWRVVEGNIYGSDGYGDYGLWSKAHTGGKSMEASYGSSNRAFVVIPARLMGEFRFWARKTSSSSRTKGSVSVWEVAESGGTYAKVAELASFSLTSTQWTAFSVDLGTTGRLVAINLVRAGIDDITHTTFDTPTTPLVAVQMDGGPVKSGYGHDFGLAVGEAAATFALANAGVGTLSATLSATGGYALSAASASLGAGEQATITVTQPAAPYGLRQGEVTIAAPGLEPWTLRLQGVVRDPSKLYVGFDAFPDGWAINDSSYATVEDGVLKATYWYAAELTSPLLTVSEGEPFYFRYQRAGSSSYQAPTVNFYYSADGSSWTQVGGNLAADATDDKWHAALITSVPPTARHIRLSAKYVSLDDLYGFALPREARLEADVAATDFGMVGADSTRTFALRNPGAQPLEGLSATVSDPNFAVSVPSAIGAKGEATLAVTLLAARPGAHSATVRLTAEGQEPVDFAVEGYAIDPAAVLLDFSGDLPRGWENSGWDVAGGEAHAGQGETARHALTSPQLVVAEGEGLAVRACRKYDEGWLRLYTSTDAGDTWALARDFADELPAGTPRTLVASGLPAGSMMIRLEGSYVSLDALNGLHPDGNAPRLRLTSGGKVRADGDADDFGAQTRPVSHAYQVTNTGTGTLEVRIASSDTTQFVVSDTLLSVGQDETRTFGVALAVGEPFGRRQATLTLRPRGALAKPLALALRGEARDSTLWSEDFERGIAAPWGNHGWAPETPHYGNGTQMAAATAADTTYLVTPRLRAAKGERLVFQALLPWADEALTVAYSTDEQQTWTVDSVYRPESDHTLADLAFVAPADGCYFLRFSGAYSCVDNFYGFRRADRAHDAEVAAFATPEVVYQYVAAPLTATVRERNGRAEAVTATLLVDGAEAQSIGPACLPAMGERAFTFAYRSGAAAEAHTFQVRFDYAGGSLLTGVADVPFALAPVVSEEGGFALEAATYPAVVLRLGLDRGWNTLALPFDVTDLTLFGEGTVAYDLVGQEGDNLKIARTAALEGGYPYLLKAEGTLAVDTILYDVEATAPAALGRMAGGVTLQATFSELPVARLGDALLLDATAGRFAKGRPARPVRALHAYLLATAPGADCLYLLSDDGEVATRVASPSPAAEGRGRAYDLGGRPARTDGTHRGVYILDGKKHD